MPFLIRSASTLLGTAGCDGTDQQYCSICDKVFKQRKAFMRHVRESRRHNTPQEAIPCPDCSKTFTRAYDLQRHRKEQHGDGKVPCARCGKRLRPHAPHNNDSGTACIDITRAPADTSPFYSAADSMSPLNPSQFEGVFQEDLDQTDLQLLDAAEAEAMASFIPIPEEARQAANELALDKSGTDKIMLPDTFFSGGPPAMHALSPTLEDDASTSIDSLKRPCGVLSESRSFRHQTSELPITTDGAHSSQSNKQPNLALPMTLTSKTIANCLKALGRFIIKESSRSSRCRICKRRILTRDPWLYQEHLNEHFRQYSDAHRCEDCDIGFANGKDLQRHLESAAKGECGFMFAHTEKCTGHHPRAREPSFSANNPGHKRSKIHKSVDIDGQETSINKTAAELSGDRLEFCFRLRTWEQEQLKSFQTDVERLAGRQSIIQPSPATTLGYDSRTPMSCVWATPMSCPPSMGYSPGIQRSEFGLCELYGSLVGMEDGTVVFSSYDRVQSSPPVRMEVDTRVFPTHDRVESSPW